MTFPSVMGQLKSNPKKCKEGISKDFLRINQHRLNFKIQIFPHLRKKYNIKPALQNSVQIKFEELAKTDHIINKSCRRTA